MQKDYLKSEKDSLLFNLSYSDNPPWRIVDILCIYYT